MNSSKLTTLTACLLMPLTVVAQQEQACNSMALYNTPTHQFEVQSGGIAVDRRTGLTWMRCPLGYTIDDLQTPDDFSDDSCVPSGERANLDWQSALEAGVALNNAGGFAGFANWRLPNIKELVSIVERKCTWPALNTAVFPPVRFDKYWTSSTYEQLTEAAYVEFIYGSNDSSRKDREWQVRLVR